MDHPYYFGQLTETKTDGLDALLQKLLSSSLLVLRRGLQTVCLTFPRATIQKEARGPVKPVGYWSSKSLNKGEHAYDMTHMERLAVVWAVLLLLFQLEGLHFTV